MKNRKIFDMLSKLETELIALKDIADIIDKIPAEYETPKYLVRCMTTHIDSLEDSFLPVWDLLLRKK